MRQQTTHITNRCVVYATNYWHAPIISTALFDYWHLRERTINGESTELSRYTATLVFTSKDQVFSVFFCCTSRRLVMSQMVKILAQVIHFAHFDVYS